MQKLVGTVGVWFGAEDACYYELSLRPELSQESHERNRSTLSDRQLLVFEVELACIFQSVLEGFREVGSVETVACCNIPHFNLSIIRWVLSQSFDEEWFRLFSIFCRRNSYWKFGLDVGKHHIASFCQGRVSFNTSYHHLRLPAIKEQSLKHAGSHPLHSLNQREGSNCRLSQFFSAVIEFFISVWWNINLKFFRHITSFMIL